MKSLYLLFLLSLTVVADEPVGVGKTSLPDVFPGLGNINFTDSTVKKNGTFNGRPLSPEDALAEDEFTVLSREEQTVQVRKPEDFPQVLKPGQRIALFLDELPNKDYLVRFAVGADVDDEYKSQVALSVQINEKPIWKHFLYKKNSLVSAVIPSTCLEKGGNLLQIHNLSMVPVCFDFLFIEEFQRPDTAVHLLIEGLNKMPYPARSTFNIGIIDLTLPEKKDEEELTECLDKEPFNREVKEIRIPLAERRKNMESIKAKFKSMTEKNEENKDILSQLWNQLNTHLAMGIEPAILIKGNPDAKALELMASACSGTVYHWIIVNNSGDRATAISRIIRNNIPSAEICIENESLWTPIAAFSVYYYDYCKEAMPCLVRKIHDMKEGGKSISFPKEIWGLFTYQDFSRHGLEFQKTYLLTTALEMTEWLWSGGTSIVLRDVVAGSRFFDDYNNSEKLSFYSLKRMAPLFEGEPFKLYCNLTPISSDDILKDVYWAGTVNSEGVATVQIATRWEKGKEVELLCPLPWNGKTKIKITSGFVSGDYPIQNVERIQTQEEIVNIENAGGEGGLFKYKFPLSRCITIRLVQDGKKEPERLTDLQKSTVTGRPKFEKGILKTSDKHPANNLIRTTLRSSDEHISIEAENYVFDRVNATRGTIEGVKDIVPWEAKSDLIGISYPDDKFKGSEGVRLHFQGGPGNCGEFSFWVYPRAGGKVKRVTLMFYFTSDTKKHFLSIDLKTDQWQRVIIACDKIKPPLWSDICIVGDPKLPEYAKGNKVSFEFNSFCVIGDEHIEYGKSGLEKFRVAGTDKEKTFVFIGRPGSYFEYRQFLPEPAEIGDISELSGYEGLKYVYRKDAQLLEITGKFPAGNDKKDKSKSMLTAEEKKLIDEKSFSSLLVKVVF